MKNAIDLAVEAVLSGQLSAYAACKKYGIKHQSTVSRRLRKAELNATGSIPRPICPHCGQPIPRNPIHRTKIS